MWCVCCRLCLGDESLCDPDLWAQPGDVGGEGLGGCCQVVVGHRVECVEDEQDRLAAAAELGAPALSPVPPPARHPDVVAPDDLARVRMLQRVGPVGDGVERFVTGALTRCGAPE